MSKWIAVLATILLFGSVAFHGAAFAQTRMALPNDFGVELLGKSLLYTFTYQRMVAEQFGVEAGLAALGGGDLDDKATIVFIPLSARFYPISKKGSPFLTAGVNIVTATVDSGPFDASGSGNYSFAGLGFEYRADGGLLFRGTAYFLISEGEFFIWPGLHIGYAF